MEHAIASAILELMKEKWGEDFVDIVDGEIYVTDEDSNNVCRITVEIMP